MANRGIVSYIEAKDQTKGNRPVRSYYGNLIDIILININERDSISRIASNPDNHGNRLTQLSGIANASVESALRVAKSRLITDEAPLFADDVNQIISNTENLASTVAAPSTGTKVIDCPYPLNTQIIPTNYDPEDSGGATNNNTITINKITGINSASDTDVTVYGYSNLTIAQFKSLSSFESNGFGGIAPIDMIITTGNKINIKAMYQNITTVNSKEVSNLFIVFDTPKASLPSSLVSLDITIGSNKTNVPVSAITVLDDDTCYISIVNKFSEFIQADNSTVSVTIVTNVDNEALLAQDARVCTLTYNPSNPDTECANRVKQYGFNIIHQDNPGYVYICSNTKRRITYNITSGTQVSIRRVSKDDVVYASTYSEIAQYLRAVSKGLDSYRSWWDSEGYCTRTCQTSCQASCQLACQGCYSNTCHNQNCGMS